MITAASAATERGRQAIEALMQDACVITTTDTRTGPSSTTAGSTIYTGPCRVQEAQEPTSSSTDASRWPAWSAQRKLVSIPVGEVDVTVGNVVTITASVLDAGLVGRQFRVVATSAKTHMTARRLECHEVSSLAFSTDQITILTPALVGDIYGNSLPDWTSVTSVTVLGMVEPLAGDEDTVGRDQATARYRVWLPAGTAVTAQARLEWQGLTLEVDGQPQLHADSATGLPIEVKAFAVTG